MTLLLLSLRLASSIHAQDSPPPIESIPVYGNVHFEFTHSLRIPDHHITIDMNDRPWTKSGTVEVRAVSEPMLGHGWQETARDTTFTISIAEYERVAQAVNEIKVPKLQTLDTRSIGTDGYTCVIEYGDLQNSVAIEVWVPREGKGPHGYYAACKLILETGGFDPEKVFGR